MKNSTRFYYSCLYVVLTMTSFSCQHFASEDRLVIRRPVDNALPQFRACYEAELKKDPALGGKIVMRWEIHQGGVVMNARIVEEKTDIANIAMRECIISVLQSIKFSDPNNSTVDVVYPLIFRKIK